MNQQFLFYTALPVLLGGTPRAAGRLAAKLYTDHGVTLQWFGRGWHPLAVIYTTRHPVATPFHEDQDGVWVRSLLDFAKEQRRSGGILCLIPGSDEAKEFLGRVGEKLEEYFVILERPAWGEDPLYGLVHSH